MREYWRNNEHYADPTVRDALGRIERTDYQRAIRRGEVYYINGARTWKGSNAVRAAVIVSNDVGNRHSDMVIVVYMTCNVKKQLPTHAMVNAAYRSTVLCEQVETVAKERIGDYVCTLSKKDMASVDRALMIATGVLEDWSTQ